MTIQWSFLPFTVADGPSKGLTSAFPVLKQEVQVTKALVFWCLVHPGENNIQNKDQRI